MITEEDKKIIDAQSKETLTKWWVKLNKWGWPKQLPNKPKYRHNDGDARGWDIMCYIHELVGNKATSWEWNKDNMSREYFEEWYAGTYESPDKPEEERMQWLDELNKKYKRTLFGKRV